MHLNPYALFALSGFLLGLTYVYFQLNFFKKIRRQYLGAGPLSKRDAALAESGSAGAAGRQSDNEYRIGYILQHIDDPAWSHLTLEGMGMEAGCRSRSAFLRAFKRITGVKPSAFRNRNE
jgi:AraC-like DNA-binding protein